jgi:hypothetical protein
VLYIFSNFNFAILYGFHYLFIYFLFLVSIFNLTSSTYMTTILSALISWAQFSSGQLFCTLCKRYLFSFYLFFYFYIYFFIIFFPHKKEFVKICKLRKFTHFTCLPREAIGKLPFHEFHCGSLIMHHSELGRAYYYIILLPFLTIIFSRLKARKSLSSLKLSQPSWERRSLSSTT